MSSRFFSIDTLAIFEVLGSGIITVTSAYYEGRHDLLGGVLCDRNVHLKKGDVGASVVFNSEQMERLKSDGYLVVNNTISESNISSSMQEINVLRSSRSINKTKMKTTTDLMNIFSFTRS